MTKPTQRNKSTNLRAKKTQLLGKIDVLRELSVAERTAKVGGLLEKKHQPRLARLVYDAVGVIDRGYRDFRIGNMHYLNGNYKDAVPHLKRAALSSSGGSEAARRLIISMQRSGDHGSIAETVAELFDQYSQEGETLNTILSALDEVELFEISATFRNKQNSIPSLRSTNGPAWQKVEEKRKVYDEFRDDPGWVYKFAVELEEAGRFRSAAEEFRKAFEASPKSWWAYRSGLAFELAGAISEAEEMYALAIELDRKFSASELGIGPFHVESKHWDLAAESFSKTASQLSSGAIAKREEILLLAARTHARCLDLKAAIEYYRAAFSQNLRNSKTLIEFVNVLELAGENEEALTVLNLAEASPLISPKQEELYWEKGRVLYYLEDFEGSFDYLRMSLALDFEQEIEDPSQDRTNLEDYVERLLFPCESLTYSAAINKAELARSFGHSVLEEHFLKIAFAQKAILPKDLAIRLASFALKRNNFKQACEYLMQTRYLFNPRVYGQESPKRGSYGFQTMMYADWSDFVGLEEDFILYESNLGLSVDCNPLAICRHLLAEQRESYIHIWAIDGDDVALPEDLTSDSRVVFVKKHSFEYTKLLAISKYLVNNSTFPTYFTRRNNQKYLMTWHGTPLKTLAKDQPSPFTHANMSRNYLQASLAIFPNQHTKEVLIDRGDIDGLMTGAVEITGYPRNDCLVHVAGRTGNSKPKAMYAPTWREDSEMEEQARNLVFVAQTLEDFGFEAVLRAHHYVEKRAKEIDPSINFLSRTISTYDELQSTDLLITDFSSIYFDWSVTQRPTIFYTPDWEGYAESRGVYFEPETLPGRVCFDQESFVDAIRNVNLDESAPKDFLERFCSFEDGNATQRVVSRFFDDKESLPCIQDKDFVLMRQSFIPNGMASSFKNIANALVRDGQNVVALTEASSVKKELGRQKTLEDLPDEVRVIGRQGAMVKSSMEFHALAVSSRIAKNRSEYLERRVNSAFRREASRVIPTQSLRAAIEFDGYSEFMARLVLGISEQAEVSGIFIHNDLVAEAEMRMPELWSVIREIPRFDKVPAVSRGLMELSSQRFKEVSGRESKNLCYIENMIDLDSLIEKSGEIIPSEIQNFVGEEEYFVHVGRVSPEKNHKFLLQVVEQIRSKSPNFKVIVLGDGPLLEDIQEMVFDLKLENNVLLYGWTANPYPVIAKAKALLLPSLHEGQPMVILEANALQTPVIASDIPAVRGMQHLASNYVLPLETEIWADFIVNVVRGEMTLTSEFNAQQYVTKALEQFKTIFGLR